MQRLAQPRAVSPDPTKYSRELSWERGGARGAFRSRVPRVEPTRRSESPGPGAYRVPTPPPISPTAATLRGREPRFPKQTRGSSALGPGAFDIARSDLVKPSYNVTYDV